MNILSTLISPDLAINMLRKNLKKMAGKDVTDFSIFFDVSKDSIDFIVDDEIYSMQDKKINEIVVSKAKSFLTKNQKMTMIMVICNEKITANVYYIEGTQKNFKSIKL